MEKRSRRTRPVVEQNNDAEPDEFDFNNIMSGSSYNVKDVSSGVEKQTHQQSSQTPQQPSEPSVQKSGATYLVTEDMTRPDGVYFVAFIHKNGARKEEIEMHVTAKNNIPEYKANIEGGFPHGVKVYVAFACLDGNAKTILEAFDKIHGKTKQRGNNWYIVSKDAVDKFVQSVVDGKKYIKCTENKAQIKYKPSRGSRIKSE